MARSSRVLALAPLALVALVAVACGKDEPPVQAPTQGMVGQPCQPGQPCANAPAATAPPPATGAPPAGAPAPGQMNTPGPTALPCQNDTQCLTHKCNTQFQKCAFPCASDVDCVQGSTCVGAGGPLAACWPKPAGT